VSDGADRYDVIVVGGRMAGASLAVHLRRAGLSVVVVDKSRFPSDTPSTHWIQAEGVACLDRLGVVERLLASGAPWLERIDATFEHVSLSAPWPKVAGDAGPAINVRRPVLDSALVDAAVAAGVEVRTSTKVVGLMESEGRVTGVRATAGDDEVVLEAPLVVGADGMSSAVGRMVGARRYHVLANQRFGYWGFFRGARWDAPAAVTIHRQGDDLLFGMPSDDGLYLAATIPSLVRLEEFRADAEASYSAHLAAAAPFPPILADAERVGRLHSMTSFPIFFRESAGPGWVLTGDAGHFKDPAGAQGISDALRQSETVAEAIVTGFGSPRGLDDTLAAWWKWRDTDAIEMHWFAADLGAAGPMPPVVVEMLDQLCASADGRRQFLDLFNHRMQPTTLLTPPRLLAATGRLLRRGDQQRREVLSGTLSIGRAEIGRRRLVRKPHYEARSPSGRP